MPFSQYGAQVLWERIPLLSSQLPVFTVVLLLSLGILAWSADRFVETAAIGAKQLGISALTVGILIIGLGTSLPEIIVSALAAYQGNPGIALGNALGSNIANIGLILGVIALIAPIALPKRMLTREYRILLIVTVGVAALAIDSRFTRLDGAIMLLGLAAVLAWLFFEAKRGGAESIQTAQMDLINRSKASAPNFVIGLFIGLGLLLISSQALVWSASGLASLLGVSDLIIGLSIVAIGTSLPELAAGIASMRRGHDSLIMGNIIGSCIFNLLAVIGIAALVQPFAFSGVSLLRDYGIMVLFLLVIIGFGRAIGRGAALFLLTSYIGYQALLLFMGE